MESVESDLNTFAKAVAENAELANVLKSPVHENDERRGALQEIAARQGAGDLVKNFIGVVANNGRSADLPGIATAFKRLSADHRGVTQVRVTSAHTLSDDQLSEIKTLVAKTAGDKIDLDLNVDPDLIGGFRIRIGSRLIDASIRSKLERLNHAMKGA